MEKNWRAQLELEEVVVPVPYWYQWWLDHFKLEGGKAQYLIPKKILIRSSIFGLVSDSGGNTDMGSSKKGL